MLFGGYSKSLFGTRKIDERTKDIPLEGNLVAATYILTYEKTFATPDFSKSLPAAYLVRWYDVKKSFYFRSTKVPSKDELFSAQINWFKRRGYILKEGLIVPTLNDTGAKDARRLITLRNYLKDVKEGRDTLVPGDGNMAEYVVYSILFGFDDLFVESARKVLPKELIEVYNAAIDLAEAGYDGYFEATD